MLSSCIISQFFSSILTLYIPLQYYIDSICHIILCTKMICRCFCCISKEEQPKISVSNNRDYPWEMYSLKELLHATNNFHQDNKIGEGGFGSVHWARTSNVVEVAVKRLKTISAKTEMEFAVEVEILERVRHKNLLGLRGFYAGGDERLIVYDYMPNHSLVTHLHGHLADLPTFVSFCR